MSVKSVLNREVDIVIGGAGGAGLAAAIEARDAHANVLVIEKQSKIEESSSAMCGGVYSFSGTDFQKRLHIEDSNQLLYNDLLAVGQHKNNEALVKLYVENQLDTYNWMTNFGVKWVDMEALGGMSVPRGHVTDPAEALNVLLKVAKEKGAEVLFESAISDLVVDSNKKVTGVQVKTKTGPMTVAARKGVLLATGGFARDQKRLESINPKLSRVIPVVGLGHHGDGHRMAEALGAYFVDMEYVKPTFGIHVNGTTLAAVSFLYYQGGIVINKKGKRFVNESASYKDVGKAALYQPDSVGFQIFDRTICEKAWAGRRGLRPEKVLTGLDDIRRKMLVEANTIEELAEKIKVPAKVFKETVENYNRSAETGRDPEFGRTALVGGVGKIVKIETPPFYAYESAGMLPGTYGGIVVNSELRVLNRNGIIPGLYAAGEIVGGFHGASYMSGTAVGKAVIFGRIAGKNITRLLGLK